MKSSVPCIPRSCKISKYDKHLLCGLTVGGGEREWTCNEEIKTCRYKQWAMATWAQACCIFRTSARKKDERLLWQRLPWKRQLVQHPGNQHGVWCLFVLIKARGRRQPIGTKLQLQAAGSQRPSRCREEELETRRGAREGRRDTSNTQVMLHYSWIRALFDWLRTQSHLDLINFP